MVVSRNTIDIYEPSTCDMTQLAFSAAEEYPGKGKL